MKLDHKVVLITDAANPSGKAIVERFGREGAKFVLNYPDGNAPKDSKDALIATANPAKKQEVDDLVKAAVSKFGQIDILIHNNNYVLRVPFEECTDEQYTNAIEINAKSAFLFSQAVGASMRAAKTGGKILFVSSIHDEKPTGCAFTYSIAKGAVQMLAREIAIDLGVYNVNTNVISCGPIEGDEELFASDLSVQYENLTDRIPLRKVGEIEDFVSLALYLCSDEGKFINGEDIRVDGGFLLNYSPRMSYEEYDVFKAENDAHKEAKR